MISSKYLIGVFMTSFGCHVLLLCNYLCVHISLWMYVIMIVVYLETYTHTRSYIFIWYSISLESTLFIFYSMVTPKSIFLVSVCLILLHLVHSFVFEDFCLSCLPRWACWFQCLVEPCLMLHSSFCIFSWCSTIFLFPSVVLHLSFMITCTCSLF